MDQFSPGTNATLTCLHLGAQAKASLVTTDGIGSDLLPTLAAYSDPNTIIGYAILHDLPPVPQMTYRRLTQAAGMMVTGWHATGLALIMESYVEANDNPFASDTDTSLAQRFPTDPTVDEALWAAYTDHHHNDAMGITTYHQHVGRKVTFDDPILANPDQLGEFDSPGELPNLLRQALTLDPEPYPAGSPISTCHSIIAEHIHRLGYSVFIDGNSYWAVPTPPDPALD